VLADLSLMSLRKPHGRESRGFEGPLAFFLTLAHRAWAAFLASSLRCSGVSAAIRAFTALPLAAFPPFLPISRITLEIRSRRMESSYEELVEVAKFRD
jgi:hypothetical protein